MTGVNLGTLFASLLLEDDFSGTFKKYLDEQDNALKKANDVANGFKVAGAAIAAFGAASVGAAAELNKSMGNIATLIPGQTERILELKNAMQDLGPALGKSTDDLSQGLYELMSSMGDTADNVKILEINARAAAAGLATTQDAINLTTAVTQTYGDTSAEAFQKVSDLAFQTVNLGKTTFPELSASIGRVAPLAKTTGVSMEEMFGIIAIGTKTLGNTSEVSTQISAAITALVSPTKDLSEAYDKMGVSGGEALIKQRGLIGALQDVSKAATDANKPLIDLLGRKEAWIIASAVAGSQAKDFAAGVDAMGKAVGASATAFDAQTQGISKASFQWSQWKVSAEVAAQKVGQAILDHLTPSLQAAAIGFSDMGRSALASAGEIAQVALAVKTIGGGSAVTSLTTAFTGLSGATGATTGVVLLATAKLGLLVGAAALVTYTIDTMSGKLGAVEGTMFKGLITPVAASIDAFKGLISVFNTFKPLLNDIGVILIDKISKSFNTAYASVTPLFKTVGDVNTAVSTFGQTLMNQVQQGLKTFVDYIQKAFPAVMGLAGAIASITGTSGSWSKQIHDWAEEIRKANAETNKQSASVTTLGTNTGNAAAVAAPALKTLTERYNAVALEIKNLTGVQQAQIIAGKNLGMNAKEIASELGKLPGVGRASEEAVQGFINTLKEGSKTTKTLQEDLKKLREEMSGIGSVKDANNFSKAFGTNVDLIDPDKIQSALDTMQLALDTVDRMGVKAAGATDSQVKGWTATAKALEIARNKYEALNAEMKGVAADGIKKVADRLNNFTGGVEDLQKKMSKLKDQMADRQFTSALSDGFRDLVTKTRDYVYQLQDLDDAIRNELNPALQAQMRAERDLKAEDFGAELGEMTLKTDEFKNVLLLLVPIFPGLINAIDDLEGKTGDAKKGFDDAAKAALDFKKAMGDLGQAVGDALSSFVKGDFAGGVSKLGNILESQIMANTERGISQGLKDGTLSAVGAFAKGLSGYATAFMAVEFMNALVRAMGADDKRKKMNETGAAMAAQFAAGFGGVAASKDFLNKAGVDWKDIAKIGSPFKPEEFEDAMTRAVPLIEAYKQKLENLGKAMAGVNTLAQGVSMSFAKSAKEQTEAAKMANEAILAAMKTSGASSDELKKKQDELAEALTNKTFTATQSQIDSFNRVGTIAGAVIASVVKETGDLIGAVMSAGDSLGGLNDINKQFALGDKVGVATQQVLALYNTIKDNEDVFTSISGIGQVMTGLGAAIGSNSALANAFGDQLASDFQTLVDRGVDVNTIYATMQPQLQKLWELSQDGKIIVDDTTKALLDQAEAQGVVGEQMKSAQDLTLDVLKSIRDILAEIGGVTLPDLGKSGTNTGKQVADAGKAAGKAWTDESNRVKENWLVNQKEMLRQSDETAAGVKNRLKDIPKDFPVKVDWKVPDLKLPNAKPYIVPVEFETPDGTPPWQENYPKGSQPGNEAPGAAPDVGLPGDPRVGYEAASATTPASMIDGGRGTQTIIIERDGQKDLQFTAENLPSYVRVRAGNTVLGV
jgi:TP901 family phage tail tape measure protein